MKKFLFLLLILCTTIQSYSQSKEAFFTTEELKAIRKQQIRLKYCDSSRFLLSQKDTINQKTILKLQTIAETQRKQIEIEQAYTHDLKERLVLSDKEIKALKRKQRLFKIGFITTTATTGAVVLLLLVK